MDTKSNRSLARTITELERARTKLLRELASVDARLQTVARALNGAVRGGTSASGQRSAPAGKSRRAWFERDEAGMLLKKAAKKPSAPADLVRELAKMKGYDRLQKQELRRFQGAAFMAISQALKTGALKKQGRSGLLVAA